MKKLLLVLLVLLGLNTTQAQINPCDSMTVSGSQSQMSFEINGVNTILSTWETWGGDSVIVQLAIDTMTNTHTVTNLNSSTNLPYDTLQVWVGYGGNPAIAWCAVTWIWDFNNGMWARMGMMPQQPYFCCDSITYWTDHSQGFNVGLDTSGMIHNPDSIEVWWAICTNNMCYSDQGMFAYFPQVTTSDTVKVEYNVYLYEANSVEVCTREDWLIFNGTSWVLFNMTTSINELTFNRVNDNKMYDLMGREVTNVALGTMYIKNGKKYIRIE